MSETMNETMMLPPAAEPAEKRAPTVYFIDDSATMREVIKIAFRRENIQVITCADGASALAQFEQNPPDAVITDVIMPDTDGYSVCSQIKQHPQFGAIPVVLMSGVVNKAVADKAVAVKADELIRKPFQPQDLIGRVKSLLNPKGAGSEGAGMPANVPPPARSPATSALSSLFASQVAPPAAPPPAPPVYADTRSAVPAWPQALANAFSPQPAAPPPAPVAPHPAGPSAAEVQRHRNDILRLELLVKKLQTELQLEREYNQTLEQHIKALRESE